VFSSGIGGVLITRFMCEAWCFLRKEKFVSFRRFGEHSLRLEAGSACSQRILHICRLWVVVSYCFFGASFLTSNDVLWDDSDGLIIIDILNIAFWYTRIAIDAHVRRARSSPVESRIKQSKQFYTHYLTCHFLVLL
jgi:hypothetical protein